MALALATAPITRSHHAAAAVALTELDFDDASVRSAAPSYSSAAPSYQTTCAAPQPQPAPVTSPLEPVHRCGPADPGRIVPWPSVGSSPAAVHYRRVAQRRVGADQARRAGMPCILESGHGGGQVGEDVLLLEDRRWDRFLGALISSELRAADRHKKNVARLRASRPVAKPTRLSHQRGAIKDDKAATGGQWKLFRRLVQLVQSD